MYSLEDRQHLGWLPFWPNVQYSLLAKTICFCPFCFVYEEKLLKLSHMWNHSLTLRLFLLPSRLLCSLVRGGTCPLGPYRLIAYVNIGRFSEITKVTFINIGTQNCQFRAYIKCNCCLISILLFHSMYVSFNHNSILSLQNNIYIHIKTHLYTMLHPKLKLGVEQNSLKKKF